MPPADPRVSPTGGSARKRILFFNVSLALAENTFRRSDVGPVGSFDIPYGTGDNTLSPVTTPGDSTKLN